MNRLLHITGFLALTTVLYVSAFIVLSRWTAEKGPLIMYTADYYAPPGGDTRQRFAEFDPNTHYDAVIIGSSHAYRGYDPAVFGNHGFHVFNLGSSAQTPMNSYWLIKEFLDTTVTPLLILDVYEGMFQNPGLESTSDLTRNQPSVSAALGMVWSLRDLRGLNLLAARMLSPRLSTYPMDPAYIARGFAPHVDSIKTMAPLPSGKHIELLSRQKHYFELIIDLCHKRGIALVVSSHFARRNRRGERHVPLSNYLHGTLAGTGIPYLDFTDAPGINGRYWFADGSHLNTTGARIFTEQLVDSLESLGYLHKRE